jgi:hypothetical protein
VDAVAVPHRRRGIHHKLAFTRAARPGRTVSMRNQVDADMFERAYKAVGLEDFRSMTCGTRWPPGCAGRHAAHGAKGTGRMGAYHPYPDWSPYMATHPQQICQTLRSSYGSADIGVYPTPSISVDNTILPSSCRHEMEQFHVCAPEQTPPLSKAQAGR